VKTEDNVQIIEVLDDGVDVFGDRGAHTTIQDSGGPRWVGPVAGIALLALIGYGVATSASTSSVPKVAPAPPTTARIVPPTTAPAPTSTVPAQAVPYYAADPPREYVVQRADLQDPASVRFQTDSYQLWATSDASATSGAWFSIESRKVGPQSIYATDATRVQAGGQLVTISHAASGHTTIQASIAKTMSVTITSFGWSDDDLLRLVPLLSVSNDGSSVEVPVTDSLISGYAMYSSVQPWFAIQGVTIEQVIYASVNDPNTYFSLGVAPRPPSSQGGSTVDRLSALRFFLDQSTQFVVDGHIGTAGEIIGQPGQSIASWIASDHIVSISAQMPVDQLVAIAETVHQVTSDVWNGMKFQAIKNEDIFGSGSDYVQGPIVLVSSGTDANGEEWRINVGVDTVGTKQRFVNWQWNNGGFGMNADAAAQIRTLADSHRTYVMGVLPHAVATGAQLQVTIAGLPDPVSLPFIDTDATLDRAFAAYAFSELGPFSVQIVGTDGAVLATWPSA
jgi:hypothetical protein